MVSAASRAILALLKRGDGAFLQVLDASDQLLELHDLLLVLGDGNGDRPAGGGNGIGAIADLLAQDHQRVAVDDRLGGFVAVAANEGKKLFQHFRFSSMNGVHECNLPHRERRSRGK
jgi:hypothetical protein